MYVIKNNIKLLVHMHSFMQQTSIQKKKGEQKDTYMDTHAKH